MNQQKQPLGIYPTPQDEQPNTPPAEPKKVSFWKSKDPTTVAVRIILYIVIGIPLLGILVAVALFALSSWRSSVRNANPTPTPSSQVTQSTTNYDFRSLSDNDQQIVSDAMWLSSQPLTYYSIHKTFIGWVPDTTAIDDQIKSLGSEIKTQGLGVNTFVIYASLPQSKKIYCIDNNKFDGLIDSISPSQATCQ